MLLPLFLIWVESERPALVGGGILWLSSFPRATFSISGMSLGKRDWNPALAYSAYYGGRARQKGRDGKSGVMRKLTPMLVWSE